MKTIPVLTQFFLSSALLAASIGIKAATHQGYQQDVFLGATSANKTVVLDFHQDGCGTCQKQEQVIKKISKEDAFSDVTFLKINFDKSPELQKKFKVSSKSTLVVFKGSKEVSRAVGMTNDQEIKALVTKGLQ